jgi:hypothetical protein
MLGEYAERKQEQRWTTSATCREAFLYTRDMLKRAACGTLQIDTVETRE